MTQIGKRIMIDDQNHKYYGYTGEIIGIQFGVNGSNDIYVVEINLSFRTTVESLERFQFRFLPQDSSRMFSVGDKVMIRAKERVSFGSKGIVTSVPEDDNTVYVKLDDSGDILWFFESEVVKD